MIRYLAALFAGLVLGLVINPLVGDAHLAYGKPAGSHAQKARTAKLNLAHARYVTRYGAPWNARAHRKAIPWLERVAARYGRPSEVAAAMRWWRTSGAQCVKREEGGWRTNTGNGYYGGFQADLDFQKAHGREFYRRWGTANHWPPWAQIVMAYRGWRARGWQPWPNTARECGL